MMCYNYPRDVPQTGFMQPIHNVGGKNDFKRESTEVSNSKENLF